MVAKTRNTPRNTGGNEKPEKKQRERKNYAPVSLDALKPEKVTKEEKVTVLPGRERSDEQKAVDATVRDLAYENIRAGLPKQFRDMPALKYTLPPAQAETVRFMVGKAGNLLNCKIKYGRTAWDEGNEVVTFAAIPRDPSQWTDNPPEEKPEEKSEEKPEEKPEEKSEEKPEEKPEEKRSDPSEFMES